MDNSYAKIVVDNLAKLYGNLPGDLAIALPAQQEGESFIFDAFGEKCRVQPEGIFLSGEKQSGVLGILISLYLLHAKSEPCVLEPFQGFKDLRLIKPLLQFLGVKAPLLIITNEQYIGLINHKNA